MDKHTREMLKDRMRHEQEKGKVFSEFLRTIKQKNEPWTDEYENDNDGYFEDLMDLWKEVEVEV